MLLPSHESYNMTCASRGESEFPLQGHMANPYIISFAWTCNGLRVVLAEPLKELHYSHEVLVLAYGHHVLPRPFLMNVDPRRENIRWCRLQI